MRQDKIDIISAQTVAFSATVAESAEYGAGDVAQFGVVLSNVGGAYDSSTGVFTCPNTGLYAFYVSVYTAATQQFQGLLLHDAVSGNDVTPLHVNVDMQNRNIAGRQSSNLQTIVCAAGDTVHVEVEGSGQILFAGYPFPTFSGYILQEFF